MCHTTSTMSAALSAFGVDGSDRLFCAFNSAQSLPPATPRLTPLHNQRNATNATNSTNATDATNATNAPTQPPTQPTIQPFNHPTTQSSNQPTNQNKLTNQQTNQQTNQGDPDPVQHALPQRRCRGVDAGARAGLGGSPRRRFGPPAHHQARHKHAFGRQVSSSALSHTFDLFSRISQLRVAT